MARKSSDSDAGSGNGKVEPPCMHAGDEHLGPRAPRWSQAPAARVSRGYLAASDPDFERRYPILHEFLTLTGWDGKARKSGALGVFAEDGVFKARIQDRENGYIAFLSSKTVEGLLEALEEGLQRGLEWREDKYARRK